MTNQRSTAYETQPTREELRHQVAGRHHRHDTHRYGDNPNYHRHGDIIPHLEERTHQYHPIRVQDIREIGQWEFLSVADEELVDTLHEHWWRDKELIRIYRGTLRLGIDLGKAKEQWIHLQGDTAIVELPGIELLDDDFIDEANSEAFFETGSWDQDAREALYQKAKRQMYERCYTRENILQAEENAKEQLAQFVKAMGFEHAVVKLEK